MIDREIPMTRGQRNNNPFNIVISNNRWMGKIYPSLDPKFEQFCSMDYGVRAGIMLLKRYIYTYHLIDEESIIQRFCPDGNEISYFNFIRSHITKSLPDSFYKNNKFDYMLDSPAFPSLRFVLMCQGMMIFESNYMMSVLDIQKLISKYKIHI